MPAFYEVIDRSAKGATFDPTAATAPVSEDEQPEPNPQGPALRACGGLVRSSLPDHASAFASHTQRRHHQG